MAHELRAPGVRSAEPNQAQPELEGATRREGGPSGVLSAASRSHLRCAAIAAVALAVIAPTAQETEDAAAWVVKILDTAQRGTGFVVALERDRATILTAYHVVAGATAGFKVVFAAAPDQGAFPVSRTDLIGQESGDETNGLAAFVVRGAIPAGVRAAPLEERSTLRRGDALVYWGYPNQADTLRRFAGSLGGRSGQLLVMDRSVGEGASGGPIVKDGRVVGIATSKDEQSTYAVLSDVAAIALRGWGIEPGASSAPAATPSRGEVGEPAATRSRVAGDVFRDCKDCPLMVVIPAGKFRMGSEASEDERDSDEGPALGVRVLSFALGRFEVTRSQFEAYASATGGTASGCHSWNGKDRGPRWSWQAPGFDQTPSDPVVCVSFEDASGFAKWLGQRTGQRYRLASEAEWEYAARAGTTTRRYWGDGPAQACGFANVADQTAKETFPGWTVHECADGYVYTAPAGSFKPNAFGLHDMLGNAWEWVEDCYQDTYAVRPTDGSAWTAGDCSGRVVRGGSWSGDPRNVRSADREGDASSYRSEDVGFRVARSLR